MIIQMYDYNSLYKLGKRDDGMFQKTSVILIISIKSDYL